MAFNFGAFVGGFSKQLVDTLEAEEERQFEMEKIAETEAMRQRAAASSRRRAEQAATEQMMGALSMFYSPENAARIIAGGESVVDQFLTWGATAAENGRDANTLVTFGTRSEDLSDPQDQETMDVITGAASAPAATITTPESADALTPTIGIGGTLNLEALQELYRRPDPTANSLQEMLAYNIQRQTPLILDNPDDPELARLQAEEQEILAAAARHKAATSDPQEEAPFFEGTQMETVASNLLRQAYTRNGFRTNIDGQILDQLEGNEHRQYLAELQAAEALQLDYNVHLNDPMLTEKITRMVRQATDGFISYGNTVRYAETSNRRRDEVDPFVFNTNVNERRYRVGDVIPVRQPDGLVRYVVYTGFPMEGNLDPEGRPYDFLFLN